MTGPDRGGRRPPAGARRHAVVATAGHVDHGKSTLVRALTGTDPDRLAEEQRRGLTIELGYAWTDLPSGVRLSLVDVPGHERFLRTMLAGVGAVPAVLLVVAADEGWRQQTAEHVAALDAFAVRRGLVAVTRSDLADPAPTVADVTARLARTSLAGSPAVAVSGRTGAGLPALRAALDTLVAGQGPDPAGAGRLRLFVDRVFAPRGAGTVVTGTLAAGRLTVGDAVQVGGSAAVVRGLESCGEPLDTVGPVARVAVNLRGVDAARLGRGDALVAPGSWQWTEAADVWFRPAVGGCPTEVVLHLGAATRSARLRLLGPPGGAAAGRHTTADPAAAGGPGPRVPDGTVDAGALTAAAHDGGANYAGAPDAGAPVAARLTWSGPLPMQPGDRVVLRDPAAHRVAAGALVLDVDPVPLRRRGAARDRAAELARLPVGPGSLSAAALLLDAVRRRGAVADAALARRGVPVPAAGAEPPGLERHGSLLADQDWLAAAAARLAGLVTEAATDPLAPGVPTEAAAAAVGVPGDLVPVVARRAGLSVDRGRVHRPRAAAVWPEPVSRALAEWRARWAVSPLDAPDGGELAARGVDRRVMAALAAAGEVVRLPGDVLVGPGAVEAAAALLAGLPEPFTASEARQRWGTTRRVAVPLLEHLDALGVTRRDAAGARALRRPPTAARTG